MANVGRKIAGNARALAPRSWKPGPHLADNISSKVVGHRQGLGVQIVAGVPHALWVTKGTKPHSIGASVEVAPGVWRYIGKSKPGKTTPGGRGKIHPGTKPNRFMQRAAEMEALTVRRV